MRWSALAGVLIGFGRVADRVETQSALHIRGDGGNPAQPSVVYRAWIDTTSSRFALMSPVGHGHHAGAEGAMPGIQRRGLQRPGGGVIRQRIVDHWQAPQSRSQAGNMPVLMTPLCRAT